jgi:hypothetical protein
LTTFHGLRLSGAGAAPREAGGEQGDADEQRDETDRPRLPPDHEQHDVNTDTGGSAGQPADEEALTRVAPELGAAVFALVLGYGTSRLPRLLAEL